MNEVTNPKDAAEPKLTLKPDYVDLQSCKIQMLFAGIAVLAICLISWSPSLRVGFLLDDYLHLDYASRALNGDWQDFLANFNSNWAGSDLMKSYRPLVSVSILGDYLLWTRVFRLTTDLAWGFHLSNLLLLGGCSLVVGLIALELSGLRGNRLAAAAAIWSALLFACYPLHLEAGAWIIGRVDLICTLFYLISVFCYFRFKLTRERAYFYFSLLAFVAAMLSKEMAVTLPVLITAAELLLQPLWRQRVATDFEATVKKHRIITVLSFWFVLVLIALWRLVVLADLIGGYGGSSPLQLKDFLGVLKQSTSTFLNSGAISRIFFPVNLDLLNRFGQNAWDQKELLEKVLKTSYLVVAASGLIRVFTQSVSLRILAFLTFWLAVALLPTFQIWNIYPNLVGSRLFFLSSAPFVILLSFLALPAIDALNARMVKILSCVGTLALLVILTIWSFWLQFDMQAWNGASESLKAFKSQIRGALRQVGSDRSILVLNLPTDYSGAGMLTRGRYLRLFLRPPVTSENYSTRVLTLDPTDDIPPSSETSKKQIKQSRNNYDYSKSLQDILKDNKSIARVFIWQDASASSDTGILHSWNGAAQQGNNSWLFRFGVDDCKFIALSDKDANDFKQLNLERRQSLPLNNGKDWTIEKGGGRNFQTTESGLRIRPGNEDIILIFPSVQISPLRATVAEIQARTVLGSAPLASFMWASHSPQAIALAQASAGTAAEAPENVSTTARGKAPAKVAQASAKKKPDAADPPVYSTGIQTFFSLPFELKGSKQLLSLGQNRNWAQTPIVGTVALYLPKGDYEIVLSSIELK